MITTPFATERNALPTFHSAVCDHQEVVHVLEHPRMNPPGKCSDLACATRPQAPSRKSLSEESRRKAGLLSPRLLQAPAQQKPD